MALKLTPDQPAGSSLPPPLYVSKARHELMRHASGHPEIDLLLEALDECERFAHAIRRLHDQSCYGTVRAVLMGRYGLVNAAEDACGDMSALAWDWADDHAWEGDKDD